VTSEIERRLDEFCRQVEETERRFNEVGASTAALMDAIDRSCGLVDSIAARMESSALVLFSIPGQLPQSEVDRLCALLAERVAQQQDSPKPPITERWREDMRLLLKRGPLRQKTPTPMPAERVAATIGYIFDEMAEPEGARGFCWAAQIRSPGALRDHWHQMAAAAQNRLKARRSPTAAILDRMSPGAGSNPLPVHLLPQTTSQRRAIR
jgi:hypothetical protein